MCIDVQSIDPSVATLSDETAWIQVNFRKDLPEARNNKSSEYECVYVNEAREIKTEAFQIAASKLKCSVPHVTELNEIFKGSERFLDQNLTVGDDGIFQVSEKYYYEEKVDRIVLPVFVKSLSNKNVRYGMAAAAERIKNDTLRTLFNLTVIDCGVYRSCVSCEASEGQCGWCENKCRNVNAMKTSGKLKIFLF